MPSTPPRWDLSDVYPGLDSREFNADLEKLARRITALEKFFAERIDGTGIRTPVEELASLTGNAIRRFNNALLLSGTLRAYVSSFVSTDSRNTAARRRQSEFEQVFVRLKKLITHFTAWVGGIARRLPDVLALDATAGAHAFMLRRTAEQSQYLMSAPEEALAAELNLSGAGAWGKLQSTLTSQLTVDFELDGRVQTLPMPALINLHSHPDESVRRRAYEAELRAWESVREPLAACMNGIKGTVNTLDRHRGRTDALHQPLDDARIDRPALEAMLGAMQASFPAFRRYFKAKAKRFGRQQLPWWDLFAPTGRADRTYTFDEARDFILEQFGGFSADLQAFVQRAFERNWIDAEQRAGKRGGAFCMRLPKVKESRVLCNFDGSLDQVSTLAHELGHAFHHYCMFEAGKTPLQMDTPMTLSETASLMCETIAMEAVLRRAGDPQEKRAILETQLIGDTQSIVDIYSRYLFEREVFERRQAAELSADELCEIMERAQKAAFGDGLDERYLHRYMWTWKPHYYSADLSFYNFPYAFGLLFGTGLYAIYQQRGADFVLEYKALLASTGEAAPADLASRFGFDIRSPEFWEQSLAVIGRRIDRYVELP